jgi:hypothetical protein
MLVAPREAEAWVKVGVATVVPEALRFPAEAKADYKPEGCIPEGHWAQPVVAPPQVEAVAVPSPEAPVERRQVVALAR